MIKDKKGTKVKQNSTHKLECESMMTNKLNELNFFYQGQKCLKTDSKFLQMNKQSINSLNPFGYLDKIVPF